MARPRYVCTFLGFGFADTPDGLVDFEAVVGGELFDGQVEFGVIQNIVGNLVGDSWSAGAIRTLGPY